MLSSLSSQIVYALDEFTYFDLISTEINSICLSKVVAPKVNLYATVYFAPGAKLAVDKFPFMKFAVSLVARFSVVSLQI